MTDERTEAYRALPVELRETIDAAIEALEAPDPSAFLERFSHPAELAEVLAGRSMERLAKSFSGDKAKELRGTLRELPEMNAESEADGARVTFSPDSSRRRYVFERIDDRWYLHNSPLTRR